MNTREEFTVDASRWQSVGSGRAELKLSQAPTRNVAALQMDFDFKDGGGFVVARRVFERAMPEDYVLHIRLRGRGAVNNLELKLVDATGQNVWRHVQKNLAWPSRWKRLKVSSRDMEFAWGPAGGGVMQALGAIEIAIVAGAGGMGTVWISELAIEDRTPSVAPQVDASSAQPGFTAADALLEAGWKPRADDLKPWLVMDALQTRTFGGLIVEWLADAPARGFRVRGSLNGRRWKTLYNARRAGGRRSYVYLPDSRFRWLRFELSEPCGGALLRLQSFEFSRSLEAFWHSIAKCEARGWHPRWLHREQSYWTPSGIADGTQCALMNEEGLVEVAPGSFSLEPMLRVGQRLVTWSDVTPRPSLALGYLPVPTVAWDDKQFRLQTIAETAANGRLRVRYILENSMDRPFAASLFVLIRPFQVTPPWQSFGKLGGVSAVHDLAWQDGAVYVNNAMRLVPSTAPTAFSALNFDEGCIAGHLASAARPAAAHAHDAFGFAQGSLAFELMLSPRESREISICCVPPGAQVDAHEPAFDWQAVLPLAQFSAPGWATDVIQAALTATAHVLVTRSGAALQPGPRRYTRSWIRDATIMGAALLRMGRSAEVREFIRWYAPYQRADGFVPCCVDGNGPDWLVEHDSHGQLIALVADYFSFTGDVELVQEVWTFIERAVSCIESLLEPSGLLPVSVSHEGYLAQPVHSYWDDFWGLRGVRDAGDLARTVGKADLVARWQGLAARFASGLFTSIEATRRQRNLDYIPGSIEWADFDPTSTANAIALLDMLDELDRGAVTRTFERYLYDWRRKRTGALAWENYTPYEIRIIGAFVRLGQRAAALELLRFFLGDRRPGAWNQWPEIAWRDPRSPAHIGDLPHSWIAAEYVLAAQSLFAYERRADRALIVAAGVAPEWLAGPGVRVSGMPTTYGALSYVLRRVDAHTLQLHILKSPKAKLVLQPPLAAALASVTINGDSCTSFDGESVTLVNVAAGSICMMAEAVGT